jgi:PAS domain S-box-containing protein
MDIDRSSARTVSASNVFLLVLAAVFLVEMLVMLLLDLLPVRPGRLAESLLDAGLVAVVLAPVLWVTVYRSLKILAAAALSKSAAVVDAVPDGILTFDEHGRVTSFNTSASRIFGYTAGEVIGKNIAMLFDSSDEERPESSVDLWLRSRASADVGATYERVARRKDGATFPLEFAPGEFHDGNARHFILVLRDISERRRAEEELRKLSQAVAQAQNTVLITDPDGKIEYANPAFERLTGYLRAEILGRTSRILKSGAHAPQFYKQLWDTIRQGKVFQAEFINKKKSGELYSQEETISPVVNAQGTITHFVGTGHDLTERKRAEAALRLSEASYRMLVEHARDCIFAVSADGVIESLNPAFEAISGLDRADWLGRAFVPLVHPDDRQRAQDVLRRASAGEMQAPTECRTLTKSGKYALWEVTVSPPVVGGPGHILGIARDITERRHLEEQLRHAQKMEAVGRLAGGVAHDFNNLLTVINGIAELALTKLQESDPLHGKLGEIRSAGERAAALTRQLLAFSRKQILEPVVLNLNTVMADVEKMLRRLIGEDIKLVVVAAADLANVRADPGQIEQVIVNLAVNARDAMPKGGTLTIETRNVEIDEAHAARLQSVPPGPYVMLAVSDTGVGMEEATRERIFDPFFTTKDPGKGTGLGLSTVYGIVKQSGGSIWVYGEVGKGCTFKMYLPRVEEAARRSRPARTATAARGTETILIVEDEEAVRRLAEEILVSAGYTVLAAANGGEALLLLERHSELVHLVLTDVVMPGMSGPELAEQLGKIHPRKRILYTSGFPANAIAHHGTLDEGTHFIGKPYAVADLTRKVREVLDWQS